jgi:hypothetical protein
VVLGQDASPRAQQHAQMLRQRRGRGTAWLPACPWPAPPVRLLETMTAVVQRRRPSTGSRPKGVSGNFPVEGPVHSGSGRSPIMSRNQSPATAVVRGWQPSSGTRSRLNDCIQRSRTGAADPLPSVAMPRWPTAMQRMRPVAYVRRTHGICSFPAIQASRRPRHQRPVSRYC